MSVDHGNTPLERRLVEKPITYQRQRARDRAAQHDVTTGSASSVPRQRVAKPSVPSNANLIIDGHKLDRSITASIEAEHRNAQSMLDATYVLDTAPSKSDTKSLVGEAAAPDEKVADSLDARWVRKISRPVGGAFLLGSAGACALTLAVLGGVTLYSFVDKTTVSEQENRTLATAPVLNANTWFTGAFQTDAEAFLSDHLFGRDVLIKVAKTYENLIEAKVDVKVERGANINQGTNDGGSVDIAVQEASDQKYIVLEDRILLAYEHNQPTLDYFVSCTQTFIDSLPDGIKSYVMVVPSRIAFETPDVKSQSDDPASDIHEVVSKFGSSVTAVDGYDAIAPHADESDLYFRTDHHWTMHGAYYAANALLEAAGMDELTFKDYAKETGPSFLGYLYSNYPSELLESHPDELVYYHNGEIKDEVVAVPGNGGKIKEEPGKVIDESRGGYYTFVGRPYATAVIDGNQSSDRVLMVVSDSYAQTIAPWLADAFGKVIIVDPRYYEGGHEGLLELIESESVTDLCVLQSSLNLPYATFSALIGGLAN